MKLGGNDALNRLFAQQVKQRRNLFASQQQVQSDVANGANGSADEQENNGRGNEGADDEDEKGENGRSRQSTSYNGKQRAHSQLVKPEEHR